jgi:hypothetical protein
MTENLSNINSLADFIEKRWFTCDQLKELILLIDDMKWSDYEWNPDDYDRTDELREQRWEFDRL